MHLVINGQRVEIDVLGFNGGEQNVRIIPNRHAVPHDAHICISAYVKNSDDLIQVLMVSDAIDRFYGHDIKKQLFMPYAPYARQDRVCTAGEAFSLKVLGDMINSCNFNGVVVDDAHSDVVCAVIDRCTSMSQALGFREYMSRNQIQFAAGWTLVAPDGGALKKCTDVAKVCKPTNLVTAEKVRDLSTGIISGTQVHGDVLGQICWIVDDICDGGYTFIKLAEELYDEGARCVNLYVTHGIFSKGKDVMKASGLDIITAKYDWTQ